MGQPANANQSAERQHLSGDQTAELAMDERTLEALRGSIAKWEGIVAGTVRNEGSSNCPLCQLYINDNCKGCPVFREARIGACRDTPFEVYIVEAVVNGRRSPSALKAAQAEVDFLRSLLPVVDHQSDGEASAAVSERSERIVP